jgi:hypothetical protein
VITRSQPRYTRNYWHLDDGCCEAVYCPPPACSLLHLLPPSLPPAAASPSCPPQLASSPLVSSAALICCCTSRTLSASGLTLVTCTTGVNVRGIGASGTGVVVQRNHQSQNIFCKNKSRCMRVLGEVAALVLVEGGGGRGSHSPGTALAPLHSCPVQRVSLQQQNKQPPHILSHYQRGKGLKPASNGGQSQ